MTTTLNTVSSLINKRKSGQCKRAIILLLFFFAVISFSFSATRTASLSGNWDNTATWGGASIPTASDDVIINVGINVTINTSTECNNLTINGILDDNTSDNVTVYGNTTINGTLNLNMWGGTKIFSGLVTINSSGSWNNTNNLPVTFRGGITNHGIFSQTNSITFDTNNQSLNGNININAEIVISGITVSNLGILTTSGRLLGNGTLINTLSAIYNNGSETKITTLINQGILNKTAENLTPTNLINSGTLNISGSVYTLNNSLTNSGTINVTTSGALNTLSNNFSNTGTVNLNGSGWVNGITNNSGGIVNYYSASGVGTIDNAGSTSLLNIYALNYVINTLIATAPGNTVDYCGLGNQILKQTIYSNLKLTGSGTKFFQTYPTHTINDTLTIVSGVNANLNDNAIHTAKYLFFNDEQQIAGSWGNTISPAVNKNDIYFTSNTGIINVSCGPNFWRGTYDTDWGTASNWTANTVPLAGKDVIYATDAVNDLVLDKDRIVGNITNETTKRLIVPAGKALTVNGVLTTSGDPDLIHIKAAASLPNGTLIFIQPASNSAVNATVEMYTTGYKGDVQTQIDPDGTEYTVTYRWQYFGIPVQSASTLPTFYNSWVRKYNETINLGQYYQKWIQLDNYSSLTSFDGYEITQGSPKLIVFQGTLVTGDKTLALTYTGDENFYGRGYNIFGNSYTAAIDITKIIFGSGVDETVYIYNTGSLKDWGDEVANTTGGAPGRFLAIPKNTADAIQKQIPSMQGFLLITSNASSVTLPYGSTSESVIKNDYQQRVRQEKKADNTEVVSDLSFMKIEVKSENTYDATWIFDAENTSHLYDNGWDGYKLNGIAGTSLYSDEEIGELQVNTVNNIDEIYLKFMAGEDGQYTLTIQAQNLQKKYKDLYLKDLFTGTSIKLNNNVTTYQFTANNTKIAEKRFLISGVKKLKNKNNPFKVTDSQRKLTVENTGIENGILYLYDAIGRVAAIKTCTAQATVTFENLRTGAYIIETTTKNGEKHNQKVMIR